MNRIAGIGYLSGVSRIFALSSAQGRLTHEQRLSLKKDGRPCPKIVIKNRDSETAYNNFLWMCGYAEKNTHFCWPCLVIGDLSKVRIYFFILYKLYYSKEMQQLIAVSLLRYIPNANRIIQSMLYDVILLDNR